MGEVQYSAGEVRDWSQNGSCGFTVRVQRIRPWHAQGMCHHFTWDGKHCVSTGFGSEHANRCAGRLCSAPACQVVTGYRGLCGGCAKPRDLDSEDVFCGPPGGVCSSDSCPFLAEGKPCPYGTSALGRGLFRL